MSLAILAAAPAFLVLQLYPGLIFGKAPIARPDTDMWYDFFVAAMILLGWLRYILTLIPRSPFWYLDIHCDGLTYRMLWRRKDVRWSQLTQFAAIERKIGRHSFWRITGGGLQESQSLSAKQRLWKAEITFDARHFLPLFRNTGKLSAELAGWLQQVSDEQRGSQPPRHVTVPENLRSNVICSQAGALSANSRARTTTGGRTIERSRRGGR